MKKTVNVAIGGRSFILDEDAYNALSSYLDSFKAGVGQNGRSEVMDELEMRIADLFRDRLNGREVVDIEIVKGVIAQLGMPDWQSDNVSGSYSAPESQPQGGGVFILIIDTGIIKLEFCQSIFQQVILAGINREYGAKHNRN